MAFKGSNYRARTKQGLSHHQYGFTLLELMIALTVFALFSATAYQSLVQTWGSQARLTTSAAAQSEQALAYRVLSTAFNSTVRLNGTPIAIEVNRTAIDSIAIEQQVQSLQLRNNSLLSDGTPILNGLINAKFSFVDASQQYSSWSKPHAPEFVEFYWQTDTHEQRWLFAVR